MPKLHFILGTFCAALVLSTNPAGAAPPSAPDYVRVAWIKNQDEFLVRWLPVSGATSYNVYYYEPTPANWSWVGRNLTFDPWNVSSFRLSFPNADSATFAVTAANADGESPMVSASVTPGPGLLGSFTTRDEWWPKGHTFVDPGFMYDRIDESIDGMVELGLSATNFTHAAWHTNLDWGHQLHITNLSPGTVWVTRMTMVNSNGIGVTFLHPYYGTYTLPLTPIDVWEDTENTITVGDYTWPAPAQVFTTPLHGTVIPGNYSWDWTYTPQPNFTGTDTFEILDNPDGPPVTITVNVQNINDPPVAHEFTVYVPEDTQSVFTPPVTDIDSTFYMTMVYGSPTYGWAVGWESTNLLYEPPANFVGTDEFTYIAADYDWSLPARVTVIVTNVNDAPTTEHQSFTTQEDTPISFTLNASDPDGDPLTAIIATPPWVGTVTNTGLDVTYTPDPNFHGVVSFEFRVSDGQTTSDWRYLDLYVEPVNDLPVPQNQSLSITTAEDTGVDFDINASDVDNDALDYVVVDPPQHGQVGGSFYVPDVNYNGTDTFTFRIFDGTGYSVLCTRTLTITPVNDVPVADGKSVSVNEDQSIAIALTGSDVDGDNLTFTIVTPPQHGQFLTGIYTPDANYFGDDSFAYKANDGQVDSDPVTVSINVVSVNDAPVADNKSIALNEDGAMSIALTGTDIDGGTLTFSVVSQPEHGQFADGVYTPAANYNGPDTFTYKANDGQTDSAPATVSITINPVNDAPVAHSKSATTAEDQSVAIALTGADIEGSSLTFVVIDPPAHGAFVNGVYTSAANYHGPDSFTYKANDGQLDSVLATVTITVTPVNDIPVADSRSATTAEDQNVSIALTGSDVDGDSLNFSVVAAPAHGTFANGVYTPAANYSGSDSFTYKANDGQTDSAVATVNITINAVNDAPVANNQSVSTPYNTAVNIVLTGSDVEGSALTFITLTSPANGTLTGTGANRAFTPNIGWSGTTSFTFKVNDGALDSATATVTITVAGPAAVPSAPSALTATAVSRTQIDLAWNDNSNNEDGFKIERSANGTSGWTQIATVGPNVGNYSNTGLVKNTRYYYRVRAYNVLGNSAYSNTANARTLN